MVQGTNTFNQLIQEREVIRANINRIEDLSQDLVNFSNLQEGSRDITPYQSNILNDKRVNLRHNIIGLKDGLQVHYDLGEEVMRPLISSRLLKNLTTIHRDILNKLLEVNAVILNLSPLGILFNSNYLKEKISSVFLVMQNLNCQESSLLAFSGIVQESAA
jgi:hypothetical protein